MSEMMIDVHNTPRQAIEKRIETCNIYIGVFDRRWGQIPTINNPEKLSVTAIEYKKARELGLARLVLVSSAEKEPELQNFLKSISTFETGNWHHRYNDLIQLTAIVSLAIAGLNLEESKGKSSHKNNMESDREIFEFYRQAFNRPAFKGKWQWHSSLRQYDQAINDTIRAINTGILTTRSGKEFLRIFTDMYIANEQWRREKEKIVLRLSNIRISLQNANFMQPNVVGDVLDNERNEIIRSLNKILEALNIERLPIPTEATSLDDV